MPININDQDYVLAEKDYYAADSLEKQLEALKRMISHSPGHKGAENLRQQLTTRRKKLESQIIRQKKSGKSTQVGVKKDDMQAVIIGHTNSGKSTLLKELTNATPKISPIEFSTTQSEIGMMNISGVSIQLVEVPAIDSPFFNKGIIHTADTLILLITKLDQIPKIEEQLTKAKGKRIIVFNEFEEMDNAQKRKLSAQLQSRKYNFVIINSIMKENLDELKQKIFQSFDKIRVFTKEPGKEKSNKPMIMEPNSTVGMAAEKILKGFSKKVQQTKIWGPSSKFSGQKVGLKHILKDMDIIEFKTN